MFSSTLSTSDAGKWGGGLFTSGMQFIVTSLFKKENITETKKTSTQQFNVLNLSYFPCGMYRERIEKWENISKSLYTNRSHQKAIAQKCLKKNNNPQKKDF